MNETSPYSIQRISQIIKETIERNTLLRNVWIEGEIENLNYHSSGHIYFSLRDKEASLSCTFFKNQNALFKQVRLVEGLRLQAQGNVSTYAARSSYQFNVRAVKLAGEGDLRLQIEALKKRLFLEGLFRPERKKKLPLLPRTLGVATAPQGAAFQDIRKVALRRFPGLNILLAPCLVQGKEAPATIIEALRQLQNPVWQVDVIICGRGGGSFEDLLPFSDEAVVRAMADCSIPIVSAVGHQIDNPLTDLAADVAAPTPTAAAQLAIPEEESLLERLVDYRWRMGHATARLLAQGRERFQRAGNSVVFVRSSALLDALAQRLDFAGQALEQKGQKLTGLCRQAFLASPHPGVAFQRLLQKKRARLDLETERLQNYSPRATLERGYAIVRNRERSVVQSARRTIPGEALDILLAEGQLEVEVRKNDGQNFFHTA